MMIAAAAQSFLHARQIESTSIKHEDVTKNLLALCVKPLSQMGNVPCNCQCCDAYCNVYRWCDRVQPRRSLLLLLPMASCSEARCAQQDSIHKAEVGLLNPKP